MTAVVRAEATLGHRWARLDVSFPLVGVGHGCRSLPAGTPIQPLWVMPAGRRRDRMASHDTVIETVREAVTAPQGNFHGPDRGAADRMITVLVRHGDAG